MAAAASRFSPLPFTFTKILHHSSQLSIFGMLSPVYSHARLSPGISSSSLTAVIYVLLGCKHWWCHNQGAVSENPVSVSLPPGLAHRQTPNALLWNAYLCLDTSIFDSTRAMFWILFQLFCWQNFIEVKCKEYNSTQWVCCRVAELCLSVLKGVDYQTTIAKLIQFTFWNHFACLSSSSCTLRFCSVVWLQKLLFGTYW